MIIGIPKEIKNNENRVGLTPSGTKELTKRGHRVFVQATAGINSGFPDKDYIAAGAEMLPTIEDVYAKAEMIIKVKEPIAPEYKLIRKGQLVFTYFHFASSEPLTLAMIESGAVCCAYETVEAPDRSLPLLIPHHVRISPTGQVRVLRTHQPAQQTFVPVHRRLCLHHINRAFIKTLQQTAFQPFTRCAPPLFAGWIAATANVGITTVTPFAIRPGSPGHR